MITAAGNDRKARLAAMLLALGVVSLAATLPAEWRPAAQRIWSYGVYYVGYRVLAVQMSCGSLAVSGMPFVMKHI